jgi:hypothetical protein
LAGSFGRGDGKPGNNQLQDWISYDQYISWNVSLREPKTFDFQLQYNGSGNSGIASIEIDGVSSHEISYSGSSAATSAAKQIALPAGDHVISIKAETIDNECLRPRVLILTPR